MIHRVPNISIERHFFSVPFVTKIQLKSKTKRTNLRKTNVMSFYFGFLKIHLLLLKIDGSSLDFVKCSNVNRLNIILEAFDLLLKFID